MPFIAKKLLYEDKKYLKVGGTSKSMEMEVTQILLCNMYFGISNLHWGLVMYECM